MKPVTVLDKLAEFENPVFGAANLNDFEGRRRRNDLADLDKCG